MRRLTTQAALAALGALGSLVVHQAAYALAFPSPGSRVRALGDHGHLNTQWRLVAPLALVAAVGFVLHQARQLGLVGPGTAAGWRRLTPVIVGLFVAQELVEALILRADGPPPWSNPALYLGVAVAPLVALAMDRALREASRVAARWLLRDRLRVPSRARCPRPRRRAVPTGGLTVGPAPRGPPPVVSA